jgi:hypothetical protein
VVATGLRGSNCSSEPFGEIPRFVFLANLSNLMRGIEAFHVATMFLRGAR